MKLLFIVNVSDLGFEEPLGILYLSSVAKRKGHQVFAVENRISSIDSKIAALKPDFIAASVLTPNFSYIYPLVKEVRFKYNIPTLVGGPHATYSPEIIKEVGIDYVFRGECEIAFSRFLDNLESGKSVDEIENLVHLSNGEVKTNQLLPLIENLDDIPFPDRELLFGYKQFYDSEVRSVIASRGCPYQCSYCFNDQYQAIYTGLGKRLRIRSVDNVVAECKELKERYKAKMIHFFDDIFPFQKDWIEEFSEKYIREINLPFITNASLSLCSEHYVSNLSKAGCKCLLVGVETGNEYFREKILFRKMENPAMIEKASLIHSYDIKIYTQNIIGLPHGSLELDLETLRLNIDMEADYAGAYLCQAYPKTAIARIAKEANQLEEDKEFNRSFYYSSNIKINDREKVEKLRFLFPIVTNFPFLLNFIYLLLKMPSGSFRLIGELLHGYKIKTVMLRYEIGTKTFFDYIKLFFSRTINRGRIED
ncbi:MAG: radical SAM protein [Candidatus Brocadiales bacterium]|nr:radical SAM protein [Candidatus Brocadiales bacterium]